MYQIAMWIGIPFMVIFASLAVIFFVRDHVGKLIGDVTGLNAKYAMNKMKDKGMERRDDNEYNDEDLEWEQKTEIMILQGRRQNEIYKL